ncbi:MAG TPA: MMPL family transporter [Verrucomicrobiae bacterium]|nr:MMPL family transporter [Verrucomicrobiae bacterium]
MSPAPPEPQVQGAPALRHPGRWWWLLLLVPVLIGLARFRFDVEVFDLLPTSLPAVEGLKLYQEHFANARELIITLQGPDTEATESTARAIAESLRASTNLVDSVTWEPPWLEHPDQAAELIAFLWLNQPPDEFRALTNRLGPGHLSEVAVASREELATSMSPQEIGRLSYDPFGLTRLPESTAGAAPSFGQGQELFGSGDGTFRVIFVKARPELRTYQDCARWLKQIKSISGAAVGATGAANAVRLGFTGRPAFVAEIAAGMQQDMTKSIGGTAVIIAVLFWLAHRRIKPMLWLLTLLTLILGSTLALGGLFFGTINVVSMGFAGILLGLAVDYAVVHYQEALAQPQLSIPQIRHAIAPSIFWAAVTTISAFLVLNFGGLPGLGQLGTLVGLGVALAAIIMIFEFLPPLFPGRNAVTSSPSTPVQAAPVSIRGVRPNRRIRTAVVYATTALLILITVAALSRGLPRIDSTAAALRPRHSPAYSAVEQIQSHMHQERDPMWLILSGADPGQVAARLDQAQPVLKSAVSEGLLDSFNVPSQLWPRPENQDANRVGASDLSSLEPGLTQAALTNGFTEQSMALTHRILETWRTAVKTPGVFWPTNPMSEWIFEKVTARTPTNYFVLGLLTPPTNGAPNQPQLIASKLQGAIPGRGVWISGWELLGSSIFGRVKANMWKVLLPMLFLVLLSLFLAFRHPAEITLSLAVLGLSGVCLLSVMRLAGWSWNLLNLMAIPLILGTGVDYSIFMQLALRRHHGDLRAAYQSVGRALLLCGGTAIAGFGSLGLSSNAGMASLGQVCAVGVAANMLIAIFLLPTWWSGLRGQPSGPGPNTPLPRGGDEVSPVAPSSLYRSDLWRAGLGLARVLPSNMANAFGQGFASLYLRIASHRRKVVFDNLAPAFDGEPRRAQEATQRLFHNFARKVLHLWRYEAGLPLEGMLGNATGWEHFEAAQKHNRGVLLLTPHLGNWEFGGPLMTRKGVRLQVLTLAEPGRDFTRLRQQSRARWNVETLVVGEDPLAFVEIIQRLEAGAAVALLIDRPPAPSAITVNLFGKPFAASIAAAELARASGCSLLPVYIPWENRAYSAHMLPPVPYTRAALRDRSARQELTGQIMRTFEPIIRQYIDQWYHFVPVWSDDAKPPGTQQR